MKKLTAIVTALLLCISSLPLAAPSLGEGLGAEDSAAQEETFAELPGAAEEAEPESGEAPLGSAVPEEGEASGGPEAPETPADSEPEDDPVPEPVLGTEIPQEPEEEIHSITIGEDDAAYIEDENGQWIYGSPDGLAARLLAQGGGTVYLLRRVSFTVDPMTYEELALLSFSCASEKDAVFYERSGEGYFFWVALEEQEDAQAGEEETVIDPSSGSGESETTTFAQPAEQVQSQLAALLSASPSAGEAESSPQPQSGEETESSPLRLTVTPPEDFEQNVLYGQAPTFALSGMPEEGGYQYALRNFDGSLAVLSQGSYTAAQEGEYSLRFSIVETATGAVVDESGAYGFSYYEESYGVMMASFSMAEPMMLAQGRGVATALSVTPANFVDSTWIGASQPLPSFTLAASPSLGAEESYGVIVDGGAAEAASSPYTPPEGAHTLQFAVLDSSGSVIVTDPTVYNSLLDTVAPSLDAIVALTGALEITVSDEDSGPALISIDGGSSWYSLASGSSPVVWNYTVSRTTVFPAGGIVLMDLAGNTAASIAETEVTGGAMGGGGAMSGGSIPTDADASAAMVTVSSSGARMGSASASRVVSHAKATVRSTTPYDAVALDVESMAMDSLSVGDQSLDLLLYDSDGSGGQFTAGLAHWNAESGVTESATGGADTLVLSAVTDSASADAYRWEVSGQVFKKLAASGVNYLVLQVGSNVTSIATSGFTAGLRYDLLKSSGVASKAFQYSFAMSPASGATSVSLNVEGQSYALSGDPGSELYYYDLYSGSPEMLKMAFGAFAAKNQG